MTALLKSVKFSSIGHSFKKSVPNYFDLNRNRKIAYAMRGVGYFSACSNLLISHNARYASMAIFVKFIAH